MKQNSDKSHSIQHFQDNSGLPESQLVFNLSLHVREFILSHMTETPEGPQSHYSGPNFGQSELADQ